MLKAGYDKGLASGTVAASGTLGQIIPPSIILIILGDVMSVSVGELFMGAVLPGLLLVVLYIVYILVYARLKPEAGPASSEQEHIGIGRTRAAAAAHVRCARFHLCGDSLPDGVGGLRGRRRACP